MKRINLSTASDEMFACCKDYKIIIIIIISLYYQHSYDRPLLC